MISLQSIEKQEDGSIVIRLNELLSGDNLRIYGNVKIHEIIFFPEIVLGSSWPVPPLLQQALNVDDGFIVSDKGTFIHCRIGFPGEVRIVERRPQRMIALAFGLLLTQKTS